MRGIAFSLEALLALVALASLALISPTPASVDATPLRLAYAADDVAEVLVLDPAARLDVAAMSIGAPAGMGPRLDAYSGLLGVCLRLSIDGRTAKSRCPYQSGQSVSSRRTLYLPSGWHTFEVTALYG